MFYEITEGNICLGESYRLVRHDGPASEKPVDQLVIGDVIDASIPEVARKFWCSRGGLKLSDLVRLGHAREVASEKFNRYNGIDNCVQYQADHGSPQSGVRVTYELAWGGLTTGTYS